MKNLITAAIVALAAWGCASAPDRGVISKAGEIDTEWVEQGETSTYYFARGIGAADQKSENKTQRLALARSAAIVSAQYNLLATIKGAQLAGGDNVADAMIKDSVMSSQVRALIKDAQIVRTEWAADDGCVVSLRLPKKALKASGLKLAD
ncbi:MAG: hypothetical protein A2X31_12695 [Elusimicrobia bacterium GWB2_63_22]|nr:MAG: hypothetical protein A2X31_12695 [Elusimicrobia bacterium GWB2_63_22]